MLDGYYGYQELGERGEKKRNGEKIEEFDKGEITKENQSRETEKDPNKKMMKINKKMIKFLNKMIVEIQNKKDINAKKIEKKIKIKKKMKTKRMKYN